MGIILMIMGHVGFGMKFDVFIHAFHMPIFFFISGFLYREKNYSTKEFVKRKFHSLLSPYIVFGIIHWIVFILLYGFSMKPLIHIFTINTEGMPIAGALWFLTALFFTECIYYLIDKWNTHWLIFLVAAIGTFANSLLPFKLPWALDASFVGLGFYWIGLMSKRYQDRLALLMDMSVWQILIIGIIEGCLIFANGYVNMREGNYANALLFWINACIACYLGISISKILCKMKRIQWLSSVGKNSIVYLCLNQIVILACNEIVNCIIISKIMKHLITLLVSLVVLRFLSILFTRTSLGMLVGK